MIDGFPTLNAEIQRGFDRLLHKGLQLYVSRKGQVIIDACVGESRPEQSMTTSTLMRWLSSGKPITSVALAILQEQGKLAWDDLVCRHLPEFVDKSITLKHLLTHTSGLPKPETGWPQSTWDEIVQQVSTLSIEHPPGTFAAYQPAATWFILGEIVQRLSGQSFSWFVRKNLCEPLKMHHSWNGMSESVFAGYGDAITMMWARRRAKLNPLISHREVYCTAASPGGNFRGPIRELGHFYEMLVNGGQRNNVRLISNESVSELTRPHRTNLLDHSFQHKLDFGLGFIVDSNRYGAETVPYGFGRHCSQRTFGHGGAESSCAFADPEHDLVVAWAANVRAGEGRHQIRNRAINSAIYVDLGLND